MTMNDNLMIATVGLYQHNRIDFAIALRPVKKMVIIHSSAKESKGAAEELEKKYGSEMVKPIEMDPWDYESLLAKAMVIPEKYPKLIPEYHIGLGTRVMTMALAMAAMFTGSKMFMVIEDEKKTMRKLEEITLLPLNPIAIQKRIFLEVLDDTEDEGFSSKADWRKATKLWLIAKQEKGKLMNVNVSKHNKHMNDLIEWGFVSVTHDGTSHHVKITKIGHAVRNLKHARRSIWSESRIKKVNNNANDYEA